MIFLSIRKFNERTVLVTQNSRKFWYKLFKNFLFFLSLFQTLLKTTWLDELTLTMRTRVTLGQLWEDGSVISILEVIFYLCRWGRRLRDPLTLSFECLELFMKRHCSPPSVSLPWSSRWYHTEQCTCLPVTHGQVPYRKGFQSDCSSSLRT